jgi:hypothetical protein
MTTTSAQTSALAGQPQTDERTKPASGQAPVAAPAAGYIGTFIALIMLSVGVVALRDSAVSAGWFEGRLWISAVIEWIDGLTFQWWMIPVGIAAIIIGLWWVYAALRPRRRTAVAVDAHTSVWISTADLARIASHTAETMPGVLDARSSARPRKVKITADVTVEDADKAIKAAIGDAVRDSLTGFLTSPPKIVVRTRTGGR